MSFLPVTFGQTIGASMEDVWQQYYTYDGTNRLAMASENAAITGSSCPGGATWCQKYGYDHFGNRWISASLDTLHMATPTAQSAVSLATNRLTSGTYDAAGNLTAQAYITTGGGSMAYDANNKMTSFTATGVSVSTKYDTAGRRVRKVYNGQTTIWVYDAFGKLAAEYTTATQTTPVGTYYRTTDHLGSTRLVTDESGRVRQRLDFFPFGGPIPASASFGNRNDVSDGGFATYNASLSMRQQFTGQQRDEETGLDYFWARNVAAPLGRFLSMDPENAGAGSVGPQTWNAYSYGANSPLRIVDPDGRCGADVTMVSYDEIGNVVGIYYSPAADCGPSTSGPTHTPWATDYSYDSWFYRGYLAGFSREYVDEGAEWWPVPVPVPVPEPEPEDEDVPLPPGVGAALRKAGGMASTIFPCQVTFGMGYGFTGRFRGRLVTRKDGFSVSNTDGVGFNTSVGTPIDGPVNVGISSGVRISAGGVRRSDTVTVIGGTGGVRGGGFVSRAGGSGDITVGVEGRIGVRDMLFLYGNASTDGWAVASPCSGR